MTDELWPRVEAILDRIVELPEDQWSEELERATEGDETLRAEVQRMLDGMAASEGMLETPPPLVARDLLEHPPEPVPELAAGTEVGRYRVIEPLGRGGMGAVFLAERSDGSFEKQVALKVVQRTVANPDTLRRFESERRLLARLDHPHIAGILDGGITDDGLPYFVMDLARGDPIDVYCDRLHLDVDARVELFRTVCDAVQYAHGSLVVHRDLKPSNIVVDGSGSVHLLDFGIAKALDETGNEGTPQTIGPTQRLTPEYAAPEQVTGEPTTAATDVYALGAVLYELLTGERPYEITDRSIAGIARAICTTDPTPPSARVRDTDRDRCASLQGDLDAILLKALEKTPGRRYGSVGGFSADLRRYLQRRPIQARPNTRWYRTSKFVRRYRTQVGVGVVTLAALSAAVVATTLQWRTAVRERGLREQEAERANLASGFLLTTLQDLAPERLGKPTLEPREVILLGLDNLDDLQTTPDLRASVMNTLGEVSLSLSEYDLADSLFGGALTILEREGGTGSALDRAQSMTGLGYRLLRGTGDIEGSIPWFQGALDLRQAALPPGDSVVARSLIDLGFALYAADRPLEASVVLQRALAMEPPDPLRARGLDFLTNALVSVAREMNARDPSPAAADTLTRAHAVGLEALALGETVFGSSSSLVSDILMSLTQVAILRDDPVSARRYSERALAINQSVFGLRSSRTAVAYGWVAQAAEADNDLDDAEAAFRQAIAMHEAVAPARAWRSRMGLARVLAAQSRFSEAESLLMLSTVPGAESSREEVESALEQLVSLYEQWERPERAREYRARLSALP